MLAEFVLGFNRLQAIRRIMYIGMPEAHAEEYLRVFREPGALTAILNWYRAVGHGGTGRLEPDIETPLLFIWGNRDPAAGRKAVRAAGAVHSRPLRESGVEGRALVAGEAHRYRGGVDAPTHRT